MQDNRKIDKDTRDNFFSLLIAFLFLAAAGVVSIINIIEEVKYYF